MKATLVEHHTKYAEIHGVDETVWLTISEHVKLHKRLRREGKCKIPPAELKRISKIAQKRTDKEKNRSKIWHGSNKAKENDKKYHSTNKWLAYLKNTTISFSTTIGPNVILHEQIRYFPNTGTFYYISYFKGNNNSKPIEMGCID